MPTHMAALDGPELVDADELDRFVGPKIRARLEERYWQPIERATSAESFLDDEAFFADPSGHPATFSDHGVVHVRDVARQAIRLAEELNGGLLPSRCDDRLRVIQGSAVLMAYLHDIGMVAATPAGRRVHAQFAAQTALGAGFDDLAEELWSSGAAGLRTRIEADTAGGADVAGDVVLREVLALSVCHSKSAVPAQLLDDPAALRRLMLRATFTDLDKQTAASNEAWWTAGRDTSAPSSAVARYRNVDADAFAWLVDPRPAARRFVTDVIDAIRVLRAADALRQRGTTQRTSAGYEVCVDHRSGRAVMALRSDDRRFGAWMWLDNRHSIAEGNLRVVDLTLEGSLRVAFDRGSFGGHGATERVAVATADMIADIEADVLGSFPRRPGAPRSARLVEIVAPPDDASFARLVVDALERRHPQLARTTVVVDQPHPTPPVEAAGWHRRAAAATIDHSEVEGWFEQLSLHGLRVDALDRQAALRDALHVRLRPGEVVLSPGSTASVVLIPLGPGLGVEPIGGYRPEPLQPWLPIGATGVVRGAERNAAVIADAEVDVLVIPAETYLAHWFKPYTADELPTAWRRWLAAREVPASDHNVLSSFTSTEPSRRIVKRSNSPTSRRCRPAKVTTYADHHACQGPVVAVGEPSPSGRRAAAKPPSVRLVEQPLEVGRDPTSDRHPESPAPSPSLRSSPRRRWTASNEMSWWSGVEPGVRH